MITRLHDEGLSPNTQRLARSVLLPGVGTAETDGLVTRNVAGLVDGVRLGKRSGRTLTPAEARTLLTAAQGHPHGALVAVLVSLGLRPRRSTRPVMARPGARRHPGHRHDPPIAAQGCAAAPCTSTNRKRRRSRRTISLPVPLVDVLRRHRAAPNRRNAWRWVPAGKATGPPPSSCSPRRSAPRSTPTARTGPCRRSPKPPASDGGPRTELRHSAASILLAQGVPLKVVSQMLGHSSIRVTADVYGHLLNRHAPKPPTRWRQPCGVDAIRQGQTTDCYCPGQPESSPFEAVGVDGTLLGGGRPRCAGTTV